MVHRVAKIKQFQYVLKSWNDVTEPFVALQTIV